MVYRCISDGRFGYTCIYRVYISMPIGMSICYAYTCICYAYRCISMFLVRWSGFQMTRDGVTESPRAEPRRVTVRLSRADGESLARYRILHRTSISFRVPGHCRSSWHQQAGSRAVPVTRSRRKRPGGRDHQHL